MQCYTCGNIFPAGMKQCPSRGRPRSKMIYVHLCGVIGGVVGSFIGFTLYDLAGTLVAGLLGIVIFEVGAALAFQPKPIEKR